MTTPPPEWLPELLDIPHYNEAVLESLYQSFLRDLVRNSCHLMGTRVILANFTMIRGKFQTFWHIISDGPNDDDRMISLDRCRHVPWIRSVIEHCNDQAVATWTVTQARVTRTKLWLKIPGYLVVLDRGKEVLRLVSAYPVTREHTRVKLERELQTFLKSQKPPAN